MVLLILAIWIILNGRITWEVIGVGLVIALPVYAFFCKYMKYSPKKEVKLLYHVGWGIHDAWLLYCDIVKAQFSKSKARG